MLHVKEIFDPSIQVRPPFVLGMHKKNGDISLMIQLPKHEKQMIHKPLLCQQKYQDCKD